MGADQAEAYGERNGVPGELLVRLHPEHTISEEPASRTEPARSARPWRDPDPGSMGPGVPRGEYAEPIRAAADCGSGVPGHSGTDEPAAGIAAVTATT